nr:methylated-DNA--[protein]-cysteine S-methyltransferase [Candidatus Gracilibacteria bacterium]
FQTRAWQSLLQIPFGSTRSYLDQATSINKPKAVRAIGKANGANPLIIIVPCHRVVGKNGTMTGYGGKVWRKEWLLNHEASLLAKH